MKKTIIINLKSPKVYLGYNIIDKFIKKSNTRNIFIVCDKNIYHRIKPLKKYCTFIFTEYFSENKKNIKSILKLISLFIKFKVNKNDYIAIIGGGTLLDTAGFASSIYKRGVHIINVPTTFLSMIDAGIGGKNGINFRGIKNIIGTITQPEYIVIDLSFLAKEQILHGLGELLKYAMIGSYSLYRFIYTNSNKIIDCDIKVLQKVIYECVKLKLKIVKKDPYDNNLRHILNFGHTVGHFLESLSNYTITHSDATILGMEKELLCGKKFGVVSEKFISYFYDLLQIFKMERKTVPDFTYSKFTHIIGADKKIEDKNFITLSYPVDFNKYNLFFKVKLKKLYNILKEHFAP